MRTYTTARLLARLASMLRTLRLLHPEVNYGHPNYWAQMGLRSCLRQVWNGGVVRGGSCTISGTGLVGGEPQMALN
jgi:hypothetical protein